MEWAPVTGHGLSQAQVPVTLASPGDEDALYGLKGRWEFLK